MIVNIYNIYNVRRSILGTYLEPHLLLYEGAWLSAHFCTATIILGLAECPLSGTERLQWSVSRRLKMYLREATVGRVYLG